MVRLSRWLFGAPRGPVVIAGRTFFDEWVVGCAGKKTRSEDGTIQWTWDECEPVRLADLASWPTRRGVWLFDFGTSIWLAPGEPAAALIWERAASSLWLAGSSWVLSAVLTLWFTAAARREPRAQDVQRALAAHALPDFIGAVLLVEAVFCLPGLGRLFLAALSHGDAPVAVGIWMILSVGALFVRTIWELLLCAILRRRVVCP